MSEKLKGIVDFLRADGSIILNKKLARAIGLDATIMYSEIVSKQIYFEAKGQLTEDGFFFNTVENMEEDTMLSRDRQLRALKKLIQLKLIYQSNRGIPRKRYFKVNEDDSIIRTFISSQINPYSSRKTRQLDDVKVDGNNTKKNTKNKKINPIVSEVLKDKDSDEYRYDDYNTTSFISEEDEWAYTVNLFSQK